MSRHSFIGFSEVISPNRDETYHINAFNTNSQSTQVIILVWININKVSAGAGIAQKYGRHRPKRRRQGKIKGRQKIKIK